ncbi:hypothetical protein GCM10011499_35320 [Pelagibacterium lentulum]|uniref:Uncharacterized protein n=1 Tax=Pelagibacterium lentulum TaxID=2029865 RepID=A0A916RLM7_9HYPH|nr:hypothetical protein GCM10011499_35320 [Pelagibacterium lentulum]
MGLCLGPIHQSAFTVLPIGFTLPVKTAAADAEISTGFGDVTGLVCVLKNTKFARNLALILVHEHLLHPRNGRVMEMSRDYRHIYTKPGNAPGPSAA